MVGPLVTFNSFFWPGEMNQSAPFFPRLIFFHESRKKWQNVFSMKERESVRTFLPASITHGRSKDSVGFDFLRTLALFVFDGGAILHSHCGSGGHIF